MKQVNLFTNQKQTRRLQTQTDCHQRGTVGLGRGKLKTGINTHTLLYTKQVTNEDLLSITATRLTVP